eukprot:5979446-Pleurochrysis_carterae.AAC.1
MDNKGFVFANKLGLIARSRTVARFDDSGKSARCAGRQAVLAVQRWRCRADRAGRGKAEEISARCAETEKLETKGPGKAKMSAAGGGGR